MMVEDAARAAVLGAIRSNLAASAPHDASSEWHAQRDADGVMPRASLPVLTGDAPIVESTAVPAAAGGDRIARFRERLEAVGGQCRVVHGEAEAAGALVEILAATGARRVAASDHALVCRLLESTAGEWTVGGIDGLSRDDLFTCDTGVTGVQWGVAETGTIVLESAYEKHRLVSLVPPVHVAILQASDICETLGEALGQVGDGGATGAIGSRAITLVTGPSRSADIELTMVIGVHGPRAVHVIIMEEGS